MADKKKDDEEQVSLNPRNTAAIVPGGGDPKPLAEGTDPAEMGEEKAQRDAAADVLKDAAARTRR